MPKTPKAPVLPIEPIPEPKAASWMSEATSALKSLAVFAVVVRYILAALIGFSGGWYVKPDPIKVVSTDPPANLVKKKPQKPPEFLGLQF